MKIDHIVTYNERKACLNNRNELSADIILLILAYNILQRNIARYELGGVYFLLYKIKRKYLYVKFNVKKYIIKILRQNNTI